MISMRLSFFLKTKSKTLTKMFTFGKYNTNYFCFSYGRFSVIIVHKKNDAIINFSAYLNIN